MREESAVSVLAIVTARGGSKGLPRKNIRLLAGKPLIAYSIQAALQTRRIERCIVSTEDAEIKQVSREWGADVMDRPAELAGDLTPSRDVVAHVLDELGHRGETPDCFVLLQPTSPLRSAKHLTACLSAFLESSARCAISVVEAEHHPYKAFLLEHETLRPLLGEEYLDRPRQTLPRAYRQDGAMYVMETGLFLERRTLFVPPVMPYVMPAWAGIDIDSEQDLRLAELMLERYGDARPE